MTYRLEIRPLASLCTIQSGYTARGRLEATPRGIPAIQLRDLQGESEPDLATLPLYELTGKLERYEAGKGDVLFRSRGDRNTAVTLTQEGKAKPVAVLPLMILRPDAALIDPRYLTWFINQAATQRYFDSCARGTNMRMIPKRCIEDLAVAVPDLETQRHIAALDALARREHALATQLADKKLELTNFALLSQVQNAQPHGNGAGRSGALKGQRPEGRT